MDLEQQWANAASTFVALVTTYGLRVVGATVILAIGTETPVTLDPAGTWLRNPQGQKYRLKLEAGSLVFE
jgi:hypothetical protein